MFKFFNKRIFEKPVEFTRMVRDGADFVVIFNDNNYLNYEIMQYCLNWNDQFSKFVFFLPSYSYSFFGRISSFSNAEFYEITSDMKLYKDSIVLNFNGDPAIRKMLCKYTGSMVIDGTNAGNLQFVPPIEDQMELFKKFKTFFNLQSQKKQLQFNFNIKDKGNINYEFFQNKFMNFILDLRDIHQDKLKEIIISIKQNFPTNIYLAGQILKKHEFINLKNLKKMSLLELYSFANKCDMFISDDLDVMKIFRDLDLAQIYITSDLPLNSIPSVNIRNISLIKEHIVKSIEN